MFGFTYPGSDCIFLPFTVPVITIVQTDSPFGSFLVRIKVHFPRYDVPALKVNGLKVHFPFTVLPFDHVIVSLHPVALKFEEPSLS